MSSFRTRSNQNVEAVVDDKGTLVGIAYAHDAVHRDIIVQSTDYVAGVTGTRNYLLRSGDTKENHLVFAVSCSGAARVELYEGATVSSVGTAIPSQRLNRKSAKSTEMLVFHTPTITLDGSRIQTLYNGGSGAGGAQQGGDVSAHQDAEWLLKQSTDYLVRLTFEASSNVGVVFEWYEVPL